MKKYHREIKGKYPLTLENWTLAEITIDKLWNERLLERGLSPRVDRSGSCKFAALLTRELFGGKLVGNINHVFVLKESKILDLNVNQADVISLGETAYYIDPKALRYQEYRDSLWSCIPRVERWVSWFEKIITECIIICKKKCPSDGIGRHCKLKIYCRKACRIVPGLGHQH